MSSAFYDARLCRLGLWQEEAKLAKKTPKPVLTEREAEIQSLKETFDLFDVDGSGDIDRGEFTNLMKVRLLPVLLLALHCFVCFAWVSVVVLLACTGRSSASA